jgi:GTPase
VERTRILLHLLSLEDTGGDDPFAGFALIDAELARFSPELAEKEQLRAVNKIDLFPDEEIERLRGLAEERGLELFFISAKTGEGVEEVMDGFEDLFVWKRGCLGCEDPSWLN